VVTVMEREREDMSGRELARVAYALIEKADERITRLEDEFGKAAEASTKHRHDLRAEIALRMGGLEKDIEDVRKTFMRIGTFIIVLLLSLCGYLFIKAMNW
jgi:archaellum component FlaC